MGTEYCRVFNRLRVCSECRAEESYIYDSVHAHYSCTCCGIVAHNYHELGYGVSFQNTKVNVPKRPKCFDPGVREVHIYKMPVRFFKWDHKKDKLLKHLLHFAEIFDVPEHLVNKCMTIVERNLSLLSEEQGDFENNRKNVLKLRGLDNTALALLIITMQKCGKSMSVKLTQHMMVKKNLNKHVKKICKILGVNIASVGLSRLRSVCSVLQVKFRVVKKVERTFKLLKSKHQSVGEDTLLAISVYKHIRHNYKDEKTIIKDLVEFVGVNKNTIHKYLKCLNF